MTFSPQTSKTYGKYSWKAARNINIVCFCFNLNICSEPHKHTVEKASVPKLWVLLISRVTHVNEIFNEVFLFLEQNLEVLVSLCLSMDRQTNISIHRAATYYLQLLQFGHCKGEEGKRLNSLISTAFEADCCLLSQCAAEVTVWRRHQNHIIHNKQKEKKKQTIWRSVLSDTLLPPAAPRDPVHENHKQNQWQGGRLSPNPHPSMKLIHSGLNLSPRADRAGQKSHERSRIWKNFSLKAEQAEGTSWDTTNPERQTPPTNK